MLIMVLLYVPWCLCTQWWSWSCSHLTQISLLSSFVLVWMALVMVLFFVLLCCLYFPLAFVIYLGKGLLLVLLFVLLLVLMPFETLLSNAVSFFSFFISFLFFSMCFYFNLCFQFCAFFLILDYFIFSSFSIFSFLIYIYKFLIWLMCKV
jgi:hypothetical protein